MGGVPCGRGSDLSDQLIPFPCQAYIGWYSHTSAYAEACAEVGGCHMDGLFLDHFQQFAVILYSNIPTIDVGMELLRPKPTDRNSLSMFT